MKTFDTFMALTEDKDRFINKHPNLEDKQKEEIINFFKTNRQAEALIDWQKSNTLDYGDFVEVMTKFKSGRKTVLKHKSISGIEEDVDYVHIKLKRKDFLAYAPMTYEGSHVLASAKVGPCRGLWCVANSSTVQHWKEYAVDDRDAFVFLMNTEEKWAIEIDSDNKNFRIWNHEDINIDDDGIPGFDVHKELLTPALIKLYDEIRDNYEDVDTDVDTEAAESDYNRLIQDILDARNNREYARDDFDEECSKIKEDTLEKLAVVRDEAEELSNEAEKKYDAVYAQLQLWKSDPTRKLVDVNGQLYMFPDRYEEYVVDVAKEVFDIAYARWERLDKFYDKVEDLPNYEMYDFDEFEKMNLKDEDGDDIEWTKEPPSEEDIEDESPSVYSGRYSDYFDLWNEHMGTGDREMEALQSAIYEYTAGYDNTDIERMMHDCGFYDPSGINNN